VFLSLNWILQRHGRCSRRSPVRALATILVPLFAGCGRAMAPQDSSVRVSVDPRIELVSIVFRLAGNPEYCSGRISSYLHDIDQHFGRHQDHPAIERARRLRAKQGISYDVPMALAVYLTGPPEWRLRVPLDPWPVNLDPRWRDGDIEQFVTELRHFARDARFADFWRAHKDLYSATEDRLRRVIGQGLDRDWFASFFGEKPKGDFHVTAAMVNGPQCYSATAQTPDADEVYCILGVWLSDNRGLPRFDKSIMSTVVHEFCHSFVNPLIDVHADQLQDAGKRLFAHVTQPMTRQAYADWKTMMYESLVRAATVRYTQAHEGADAARKQASDEVERGFLWTQELSDLLGRYEAERNQYADLSAFFPEIARFFEMYSTKVGEIIADRTAREPHILKLVPANGAQNVAPNLAELRVTFDKPMAPGYSWCGGGPTFPGIPPGKRPRWTQDGKTCILPVKLKPGREYVIGLNSPSQKGFTTKDGVPLSPVTWRFTTARR